MKINVTIWVEDLLDMLENRWRRWTDDELRIHDYLDMYEDYLNNGVGDVVVDFDPSLWVDNDYINDTEYITEEEFEEYNIEDEYDDRILWIGSEGHYIISTR